MLWLGFEPYLAKNSAEALALVQRTSFPLMRENIARRFASEIDDHMPVVEKLLAIAAEDPRVRADILRGCAAALNGRTDTPVPANWSQLAPSWEKTISPMLATRSTF